MDGISLQVQQGEIFGLLGPNGAGKTTTIQMICGLLKPDAGEIFINGQLVKPGNPAAMRKVGICTQSNILWEKLTCFEQLVFIGQMYHLPKRQVKHRAEELLDQLGLSEKCNQLAGQLSGGMQRRLNLAMALMNDPDLVVLDEPETGLDPQSRVMVREYIHSLARKKTVILTTHNMDEADRLSDRVAIIDQGRLLVMDIPEALKRTLGDGDVLEMELANELPESVQEELRAVDLQVHTVNHTLILRGWILIEKLPAVLEIFRRNGIQTGETRMRSNTLEDVFISITGRRLRE
ncbi:MAG TPA: ABC transporter ATP-binding protein [Anaerolineaceae bacterium]|nr:ABC transporter ATP-binding protein [Anaerolineaceae bacterium]